MKSGLPIFVVFTSLALLTSCSPKPGVRGHAPGVDAADSPL